MEPFKAFLVYVALIWLLFVGCVAPDQHNEQKYSSHTVGFGPSLDMDARPWTSAELTELQREVTVLSALGPTVKIANEGSADFVLRPYAADTPAGRCAKGVGRFYMGNRYAECDPSCTNGFAGLRTCFGHEYGHWLGMIHVCLAGEEGPDCSSVGRGVAMMNRAIDYPDSHGDTVSEDVPTQLDLDEFRRVHP